MATHDELNKYQPNDGRSSDSSEGQDDTAGYGIRYPRTEQDGEGDPNKGEKADSAASQNETSGYF